MRKRTWQYVGLAVLAVVTIFAVIGALGHTRPSPVAVPDSSLSAAVETPIPTSEESSTTVKEAAQQLDDLSEPWVLAVMGDSTGNAPDEWVYLAVAELSQRYNRPAVIHDWSIEENAYVTETAIGSGEGEPIIVWNGSASGMNGSYSMEHRETMVPQKPDLVIINHGHNVSGTGQSDRETDDLVDWAQSNWDQQPAVAVTLQNPRIDEHQQRQEEIVASLRAAYEDTDVALIDVYSAFEQTGNVPSLVREDGFHPNPAGEAVWAEAVVDLLTSGSGQ